MQRTGLLLSLGFVAILFHTALPGAARSASFTMLPELLVLTAPESTLTFDFQGVAPSSWGGGLPVDVPTLTLRVTTESLGAHLEAFAAAPLVPFDPTSGDPFPDFSLLHQEVLAISGSPTTTSALGELSIDCPAATCVLDVSYFMAWTNDPPERFTVTRSLGSSAPFPIQSAQAELLLPEPAGGGLLLMGLALWAILVGTCPAGKRRTG